MSTSIRFAILVFLSLGSALAHAQTAPAPPQITGTIKSPTPVTRIVAVDRAAADCLSVSKPDAKDPFVYEGRLDPQNNSFTIPGLLPGKTYDLIVWNKTARWEGADMNYHRDITPDKDATPEDKTWIHDFVEKMPRYEDQCRILYLAADHKHATALVELRRTRGFYSGAAGEITYRVELWYFENLFGGWAKDRNTEVVLTRWRGQGDALPHPWQFLPTLGGIETPASGQAPPLTLTLPEKPDPKHGTGEK